MAKSVAAEIHSHKIESADLVLNNLNENQFGYFLRFFSIAVYKFEYK